MPELPEVETIRLGLQKYLVGHTIEAIDVRFPRLFAGDPKVLLQARIEAVRRFGKGLVIDFANNFSLVVHVKMTGQLVYQVPSLPINSVPDSKKVGKMPHKHTHVIFCLDQGATLFYNDTRKFGWMKVLKTKDVPDLPFFKALGHEPAAAKAMDGRPVLTIDVLSTVLKQTKAPIKSVLLDQRKIAGVGNIYANDALFVSKIDPRRQAHTLSSKEAKRLLNALEIVLTKGIVAGGSSEWNYVNALGQTGEYQKIFLVYGKKGQPCPMCGTPIQKIQFGGRGTYFCPSCQR